MNYNRKKCVIKVRYCRKKAKSKKKKTLRRGLSLPLVSKLNIYAPCTINSKRQSQFMLDSYLDNLTKPIYRQSFKKRKYPYTIGQTNFLLKRNIKDIPAYCKNFVGKPYIDTKRSSMEVYCERTNYENYANSPNTNIIIFGKPDPMHATIASMVADHLKYNHINPIEVINKTIFQSTFVGKWIYSNLSLNKKIPVEIILKLMAIEIVREKRRHVPFVLSGLPIIPETYGVPYGPDVIKKVEQIEVKKKRYKFKSKSTSSHDDEGEENNFGEFSENETENSLNYGKSEELEADILSISEDDLKENILEGDFDEVDVAQWKQLNNLFKSYISNAKYVKETIEESVRRQIDFLNKLDINIAVYLYNTDSDLLLKRTKREMISSVVAQITNTHKVLELIEEFFGQFSKSHGFQIDTRFSNDEIVARIVSRLSLLRIKEIFQPELVFKNFKIPDHLLNAFDLNNFEENFDILCHTDVIKPLLFWRKNECRHFCPIERYYGKLKRGKLNLAVRYLGKVILCSSFERLKEFTTHTEKYMYSQPTCRVAVLGPPKVGKSLTAKILSAIQQEKIFDYKTLLYDFYQDRMFFAPEIFDEHYKEAMRSAYNETKEIYSDLQKNYDKIKQDFLYEIFENVITLVYEVIGSSTKKVEPTQFSYLIEEFLPAECYRDFKKIRVHDPLFTFFFYDKYEKLTNAFFNNTSNILDNFLNFEQDVLKERLLKCRNSNFHSQWIIDDAPLSLDFWKTLYVKRILPDVVIIFENFNEDVIENILLHNFKSFRNIDTAVNNYLQTDYHWFDKDKTLKDFKNITVQTNKGKQEELRIFTKHIAKNKMLQFDEYQKDIDALKIYLESKNVQIIAVDCSRLFEKDKNIYKMFEYILFQYFTIFSSIPKIVELDDYFCRTYETAELDTASVTTSVYSKKSFLKVTKSQISVPAGLKTNILSEIELGATRDYCPVSLVKKNILVKGNVKYCVQYCNKHMVLDSQENLDLFMIAPQKYYFEHNPPDVPPPRICLLGPNSRPKAAFAKMLGEILEVPVFFSYKEWKPNIVSFQSRTEIDFLENRSEKSIQEMMKEKTKYSSGFILSGYSFDKTTLIEKAENYPEAIFVFDEEDNLTRLIHRTTPYERSNSIMSRVDLRPQLDDLQYLRYKSQESFESPFKDSIKRKNQRLRTRQIVDAIIQSIEEDVRFYKQLDYPIINIPSSFVDPLIVQKTISKYAKAINNNTDRNTLFYVPKKIDLDTALKCVECGYYRKSRFRLSCPVRIKKMQLFNNFYGLKDKNKIFPCIINEFVYFISTRQNLKEFMLLPQFYTNQCHTMDFAQPLIIAVMGPMYSGINSLVQRICSEYKMQAIVEFDVFNFIITIIRHTQLYKTLKDNKFKLTQDLFFCAVSLMKNLFPNGIVLNNYLLTPTLLKLALNTNCEIHIVFVLQQNFNVSVQKFLQLKSPSSLEELCVHYENFMDMVRIFKTNREICYFNIHYILDTKNNWTIWNEVKLVIHKTVRNHISYTTKLELPLVTNLAYLNTFYEEVEQGLDKIHLNCPICYSDGLFIRYRYDTYFVGQRFYETSCQMELTEPHGYLKEWLYKVYKFPKPFSWENELPPILTDNHLRNNVNQFKTYFLWTCDFHTIEILVHPDDFIPVQEEHVPKYVPFLVSNYPLLIVKNDGYCIVSYEKGIKAIDNLLSVDVSLAISHLRQGSTSMYCKGDRDVAVYYRGHVYLLADENNARLFLTNPDYYYNLEFHPPEEEETDPDLIETEIDFKNLSSKLLVQGLKSIGTIRPKHFLLSSKESASVFLGLFMKTHCDSNFQTLTYWEHIFQLFKMECDSFGRKFATYKLQSNPYISRGERSDEQVTQLKLKKSKKEGYF